MGRVLSKGNEDGADSTHEPPLSLKQLEAGRRTTSQRCPVIMATTWAKRKGLTRQRYRPLSQGLLGSCSFQAAF